MRNMDLLIIPRSIYIIPESGKIYKALLYDTYISKFDTVATINDKLNHDSFLYNNFIVFSGQNGVYKIDLKTDKVYLLFSMIGQINCIHYLGNDLMAVGGGNGLESREPGFLRIYNLKANELIKDITLHGSDITRIISNNKSIILLDEGTRYTHMIKYNKNYEPVEKEKYSLFRRGLISGNLPIMVNQSLVFVKAPYKSIFIFNDKNKSKIDGEYQQVHALPGKNLFLAQKSTPPTLTIDLFNDEGKKLSSIDIPDWIRTVRQDPTNIDAYILLNENGMWKLHVEPKGSRHSNKGMKLTRLYQYHDKIQGYPSTFEITDVDPEEFKKYTEFVGKDMKLAKPLINIVMKFL